MSGLLNLEQLGELSRQDLIDTVLVCQVDMQGRLMGKRFHVQSFLESGYRETHSCQYLLATDMEMYTVEGYRATSWEKGYGDYIMKPDLTTLRVIPWLEKTAWVLCDVLDHHTHQEVPHSPRTILKKQVVRLKEQQLEPYMASELEFFLFEQSYKELASDHYRGLSPISPYNEDYHIFQTSKEEDVMRTIRNGLYGAGVKVECTKGEASSGQEEINVQYGPALKMADEHCLIKNACKEIAWSKGKAITFLAKWSNHEAGSSSHIHQSLWKKGKPVFYDEKLDLGMSSTMHSYLAGLIEYSSEITYFLAPYVNSYKRFVGNTFAPIKTVWSRDNRTAGYRICGEDTSAVRIECRIGGADLNPYLAMAGQLAAGLEGINKKLPPQKEFVGNAYLDSAKDRIPRDLREAVDVMDKSEMLRKAMGDEVIDHYVRCGRWEVEEQGRVVTDWDLWRGFERA